MSDVKEFYVLIGTYPGQTRWVLLSNNSSFGPTDSKDFLVDLGQRLLKQNIISSYTVMVNVDSVQYE